MKLIVAVAVASTASAFLRASPGAAPPSLRAKKDKAADGDAAPVEVNALGKGSIVEFEFNKHTCIGVVDAHMVKAKGGLRYDVVTADEKVHAGVAPKDIHFSAAPLPGDKGDKSPMKRIKDFEDVLATSAARLVDPEVLEICYELAAEEDDGKVFRVKEIAKLFDEGTSPVDLYRTFRIMTSELGRVFFKSAKGEAAAFKAKAHKAVDAAKVTLCNTHGDDYGEFYGARDGELSRRSRRFALLSPDALWDADLGGWRLEEINTNGLFQLGADEGEDVRTFHVDEGYTEAWLQIAGVDGYPHAPAYAAALDAALDDFCAGRGCDGRDREVLAAAAHENAHASSGWYRAWPPVDCGAACGARPDLADDAGVMALFEGSATRAGRLHFDFLRSLDRAYFASPSAARPDDGDRDAFPRYVDPER